MASKPDAPGIQVTRRQRLPASAERVYRALTDPAALARWFCDVAEVDPRPGGMYVFGGPHAYGGPELARGRIMTIDPGRSLTYVWPLAGVETVVKIELNQIAGGETELILNHTGVKTLPVEAESPQEHLLVAWIILLRQLAAYLTSRPLPRYDFTTVPTPVVDQEILIEAPVARVWEMLTVPAELNRWVARDARVELRVGGRYSYGWAEEGSQYGPMQIVALEPPRLLAFSWLSSGVVGTVSWHLEPADEAGQSTRLRLVHEGLKKQPGILKDYDIGWWDYLAALRWLVVTDRHP